MRNFVSEGAIIDVASAPYTVVAGAGMLVGSMFTVAVNAASSGAAAKGMRRGVFDLAKASGAWTQGAKLYWDDTAKNVTTTASGNTLIGVAAQAQASGDTTGRVLVTGQV